MSRRTPLLAMLLILAASPIALAGTSEDIMIHHPHAMGYLVADIAIAPDGTIFAACQRDSLQSGLNIYRSRNGGSTWQLWSEFTSYFGDGFIYDAQLAIVGDSPGKVVLAHIDRRLDYEASYVRVSTAPVDASSPTWADSSIELVDGYAVNWPRVDTFDTVGLNDRICVVWRSEDDVKYVTSGDSGVTWSTPIVLESTNDILRDLDVAADNNGQVHATWIIQDGDTADCSVNYRRASFGGEYLSSWDPVVILEDMDEIFLRVSVAANPQITQNGVLLTYGSNYDEEPELWIQESSDGGDTWSSSQHPYYTEPEAVWTAEGRRIAVAARAASEVGDSIAILRPDAGSWSAEALLENIHFTAESDPQVALDPSRGGEPAVVSLRRSGLADLAPGYSFWFDAGWRDEPGFGIPNPEGFSRIGAGATGPIITGEIDGDGLADLVFIENDDSRGRQLSRFEPADGGIVALAADLYPSTDFALIDVDDDGDHEVAYLDDDQNLAVIQDTGLPVDGFPRDLGLLADRVWISGSYLQDTRDWIAVVAGGGTVWAVGEDGSDRPGFPWSAPAPAGAANGRVAMGDVDADGQLELVAPFQGGLVILSFDGEVEAVIGQDEASPGSPSLSDFDGDQDLEIAFPRADGTVHLVHHDGAPAGNGQWPFDTGAEGMPSQIVLADIYGDDRRDLIFMDADRWVHIIPPSGDAIPDWPRPVDPETPITEPVVAKLGPGNPVLAIGSADGRVRLTGPSGPQDGWPRDFPDPVQTAMVAADMDADGNVELAFGTAESLIVLDMGVAPDESLRLWTMSGFDPGRTGCTEPFTGVVSRAPSAAATRAQLHPAAPNPFNPTTTIGFRLASDARDVSVTVYDPAGRLVRSLHRGPLPAGDHTVQWRGDDQSGRAVSSGVYLYRLEAGGQAQSRTMVLIR